MTDVGIVFMTAASQQEAEKIATVLVTKKLAACVNIFSEITSHFWWEGKLCKEKEVFFMAKTTCQLFPAVTREVKAIHSYKVPEIIMLPIQAGSGDYLDWIKEVTKKP